ncbi:nucleoside hydrolase [Kineosporia sp. J2-2]|uniref:Nucleoside hydrolase n=1 Tax=Kineosporia corallincola TaxID=2835133 RepID=A0ABS5TAE6_9ACTN|nr:nucleoside hydrolase [Kineosporia corallincola]MBT0768031.1 nucleoside hydrolase [Kineosporia corallincola]
MPALPVFFDCDTGIDDSLALAQLVSRTDVDLVGISTVSGNTDAAQAARNTLDLLALLGRDDVPVAVGEHHPIAGDYAGGAPEVHGGNGIGDVELPRATRPVAAATGAEQLVATAREHAGRLHLIAVGPLTNLAKALDQAPDLPGLVGHVTIMGGAVWHEGNITPHAEANIHNDAEAAARVLGAGWPVTLVPLDVTMTHSLDGAAQAALAARGTTFHDALAGMLDCYFSFHEDRYGRRISALHDPMATMLATGQVTATTVRSTGIRVELEGETRGRTVAVEAGAQHPAVDVVTEIADPVGPWLLESLLGLSA